MRNRLWVGLFVGGMAVMAAVPGYGQAAGPEAQRAVLDQYCVTCHSDQVRTANLSLETVDLAQVIKGYCCIFIFF